MTSIEYLNALFGLQRMCDDMVEQAHDVARRINELTRRYYKEAIENAGIVYTETDELHVTEDRDYA